MTIGHLKHGREGGRRKAAAQGRGRESGALIWRGWDTAGAPWRGTWAKALGKRHTQEPPGPRVPGGRGKMERKRDEG